MANFPHTVGLLTVTSFNGLSEIGNTASLIAILYFEKWKRFVGQRLLKSPPLLCVMNQLRGEQRLRKSKTTATTTTTTTTTNWLKQLNPKATNPSKIDAICAQNVWKFIFYA